ncbi:MAG: Gldg family protein [Verrucomicrobiales bacterium]|nr:Gldg family protein [Verrucomicrobiales bacterium]
MATHLKSSFSPARRWTKGFDVALRTAFVLAVVVMVNYLGAKFYARFYLSSQTRVQLSTRTLNVVHSITNQIVVTVYYDKNDDWYPAIIGLLNEYRSANPNISVKTVDYMRDPGEAQKIKAQYKLSSAKDKDLVIFDCNDHVKVVNGDALTQVKLEQVPNSKEREYRRKPVAFNGEMMFTTMLLAVVNPKPLKAYFLQGHGEPSIKETGETDYQKFAAVLAESYIATEPLLLAGDAPVPDDCNLLIIAGPQKAFSETEIQKIDQYLAQGGRLFMLFNYFSIKHSTGLEPIFARWGVNVRADVVQDLNPNNTTSGQDVVTYDFSSHPAVNPLAQFALQLILPRPVSKVDWKNPPANAPKVDELAFSSPQSKLMVEPTLAPQSYPLMAAVEQKTAPGVANTRGTTRMIVVGDSFFLDNRQIESAANRDFAGYAANWLLDRTVLLEGIGPRPVTEFRLTMTQAQQKNVRWLLLAALPGGVLLFGWLVWLVRRK